MPEIKLFSINDIRNWLIHNLPIEGLSNAVISPVRAYAIMHNPYVKEDDHVVAAIYDHGELAAYTAAFPEILHYPQSIIHNPQRIWWFSTLYCNPKFRGKGYGLIVIGSLAEEYGIENCYDMWGAPETVEIFRMLGLKDITIPQYVFGPKSIRRDSLKGQLAYTLQQIKLKIRSRKKELQKLVSDTTYELQYTQHIDDETYAFIATHASNDAILRSQETLNWILQYPFVQTSPMANRVCSQTEFKDIDGKYKIICVRIFVNSQLIGVYIMRVNHSQVSVKYLYYDSSYQHQVFASIAEHILKYDKPSFETRDKVLADFLEPYYLFPCKLISPISFSYSKESAIDITKRLQAESDNFV